MIYDDTDFRRRYYEDHIAELRKQFGQTRSERLRFPRFVSARLVWRHSHRRAGGRSSLLHA